MINNTPFGHLVDKVVSLYRSAQNMPYVLFSELPLTIEMNDRMRTVGGRCTIKFAERTMVIQLNTQLFATLNDDQRAAIIAHEMAHAVVFHLGHVKENHGHIWRSVARAMGDDGAR